MRRKFFGSARALPSRKNYSPLATRCRFGSAGASPSHFIHRLKSVLQKRSLLKQSEKLEGESPDAQKIFRQRRSAALQKKLFATRHSLLAAVSARQEPRPPISSTRLKSVSTKTKPTEAG